MLALAMFLITPHCHMKGLPMIRQPRTAKQSADREEAIFSLVCCLAQIAAESHQLRLAGWAITHPDISARDQRSALETAAESHRRLAWQIVRLPDALAAVGRWED
jgi:hypothetical protein